jgi:drug/metabolite transporter (DMT)-like permease
MEILIQKIRYNQRLKSDAILLLVALVWGSGFAAQRIAADANLNFLIFNAVRFCLGALVVYLAGKGWQRKPNRASILSGMFIGLFLFGGTSLQQAGISFTTAGKAGFITGLYVVLVPIAAMFLWKQKPSAWVWVACLFSIAGLFLLSISNDLSISKGDGLELIGAFLWAGHIILISRFANKVDAIWLSITQFITCSVLSVACGAVFLPNPFSGIQSAWWAIIYSGIFPIGIGFTLQLIGQRKAPPADAAIILSLESVFASVFGWIFLSEGLSLQQSFGCALMLAGMLVAQLSDFIPQKAQPQTVQKIAGT